VRAKRWGIRAQGSRRLRRFTAASVRPRHAAGPHASLWRQVVEQLPVPVAVATTDGSVVAMNRALRTVVKRRLGHVVGGGEMEALLAPAIECACGSSGPVTCMCPLVPRLRFDCSRVDGVRGLIALIGRESEV
jgi:PAS domain-containing protein